MQIQLFDIVLTIYLHNVISGSIALNPSNLKWCQRAILQNSVFSIIFRIFLMNSIYSSYYPWKFCSHANKYTYLGFHFDILSIFIIFLFPHLLLFSDPLLFLHFSYWPKLHFVLNEILVTFHPNCSHFTNLFLTSNCINSIRWPPMQMSSSSKSLNSN